MSEFDFVPNWSRSNRAPDRSNERAYFPSSPFGTLREATFSETLAGVLGADPSHNPDDIEDAFFEVPVFDDAGKEVAKTLWDAFRASYFITGKKGVRSSGAQARDHILPFHPMVAINIEVDQPRQWYRWYWLLMTDGEDDGINERLHRRFVETLTQIEPSNLVESLVVEAIEAASDGDVALPESETVGDADMIEQDGITPLLPALSEVFQADLRAWLELRRQESSSLWMQGLRDIFCFHYMMYFLQTAQTLHEEYANIADGPPYDHEFEVEPVHFGTAGETAAQSRNFATAWDDEELGRALYDSWGRLAVMSHIVDIALDPETPVESMPHTLTDALNEFPPDLQEEVITRLLDELPADQRPEGNYDLPEVALAFSRLVRRYYENQGKSPSSQTAFTGGFRALYQLGRGNEPQFIERRRRVGTILRLDRSGLRMFSRLFDQQNEQGHIDSFWAYLRRRGIVFDHQSKQAVITQLEEMSLLQKQSDSGEAMYVEAI